MNERIRVCKWQPCTDTHWHNTLGYAVVFDHKSNTFVCAFWAGNVCDDEFTVRLVHTILELLFSYNSQHTHTLTHTYKPKQHKEEQKSNVEAANSWRSFLNIIIAWHYQSVTRYLFATFGTLFCEAFHSLFFSHFLAFSFSLSIAILIFRCLFSMLFDVLCCSKCYWCSDSFSYFRFISSNVGGKVCLLL